MHVIDIPDTFNSILVATNTITSANNLHHNLSSLDPKAHALLPSIIDKTINNLVPTQPNGMIFTDDQAPVEQLTDSILLNYLLGSNTDDNITAQPEL